VQSIELNEPRNADGRGLLRNRASRGVEVAIYRSALQQKLSLSLARRQIVWAQRQIPIERIYGLRDFAKRGMGAPQRRKEVWIIGSRSQSACEKLDRLPVPPLAGEHGGPFLAPRRQQDRSDKE
jgi:hypothetical protein